MKSGFACFFTRFTREKKLHKLTFLINFFLILALVTGSQGTCVVWESVQKPGFAYVDLRGGKSGEKKCYNKNDVDKQPFYLTIPEGKLKPDLQYKFQVKAMAGGNGNGPTGTSSLTISTTSGLTGEDGFALVVETDDDVGQALLTNYTISVINEVNNDMKIISYKKIKIQFVNSFFKKITILHVCIAF